MLSVIAAFLADADCCVSVIFGIRVSVGVTVVLTVPRVAASYKPKLFSCGTYVAAKALDRVAAEIANAAAMARMDEGRIDDFIDNSRED